MQTPHAADAAAAQRRYDAALPPDDDGPDLTTALSLGGVEVDVTYRLDADGAVIVTGATLWNASRTDYGHADEDCFSRQQLDAWREQIEAELQADREEAEAMRREACDA
ncbi:hypothetical protein ABXN37_19705 [Piscinibacter sakaiensis]|uniref:Uncharacterized protein n=1 Tax=Piscinibacter sakaiensis TaxID=1547922 RepID=A0A0K8P3Y0_PISS1|nr:hypothetical protein [Piscinibacter sakaiensis]GAP37353.1 hypothetical protein ISF6_3208 [Piscinibacter sakaiensis]